MVPEKQTDGTVTGVLVAVRDFTDRKRAEDALAFQAGARPADRAGEPGAVPRPGGPRAAAPRARRRPARRAVRRPRPLQDRQRHARPRGRRPAAARGRRSGCGLPARRGHASRGSAATSSWCCCETCRPTRTCASSPTGRRGARASRSSRAATSRSSSASIGIVAWPTPDATPTTCCADADAAMYQAKERGGGRYEVFDAGLRDRRWPRIELEAELRRRSSAASSCCTTSRSCARDRRASSASRR